MSHPRLVFKWSLTSLVWHGAQAWLLGLSQVCLALVTGNQSGARPWMRTAISQPAVAQLSGQLWAGGELAGIAQPGCRARLAPLSLRGAGCVSAALGSRRREWEGRLVVAATSYTRRAVLTWLAMVRGMQPPGAQGFRRRRGWAPRGWVCGEDWAPHSQAFLPFCGSWDRGPVREA